jgi:hypothetical protein
MKSILEQGERFSSKMTPYQVFRTIQSGKSIFFAIKGEEIRVVWAFSKEDAQKKFGGWSINRG